MKKINYIKKYLAIITVILFLGTNLAFGSWNTFLNNGDVLLASKWNELVGKILLLDTTITTMSGTLSGYNSTFNTINTSITNNNTINTTLNATFNNQKTTLATITGSISTLSSNVITLSGSINTKLSKTLADTNYAKLSVGNLITGVSGITAPEYKITSGSPKGLKVYSGNPMMYSNNEAFSFSAFGGAGFNDIETSTLSGVILRSTNLRFNSGAVGDNKIGNGFSTPGLNIQGNNAKINLNGTTEVKPYNSTNSDIFVGGSVFSDQMKFEGKNSFINESFGIEFNIGSDNNSDGFNIFNKNISQNVFKVSGDGITTLGVTGNNIRVGRNTESSAFSAYNGQDTFNLISSYGSSNAVTQPGSAFNFTTTQPGNGNQCGGYSCLTPMKFLSISNGTSTSPETRLNGNFNVNGNFNIAKNTYFGNYLKIASLSSNPVTVINGSLYYNTSTNKMTQYTNSVWSTFGASGSGSNFITNIGSINNIVTMLPTNLTSCIGGGCTYQGVGGGYDGSNERRPAKSCLEIRKNYPDRGDGQYRIMPEGQYKAFQAFCDMVSDGGGYTIYPVDAGIATSKVTDYDSCKEKGMHLFVPRTKAHFDKAVSLYNSYIVTSIVGVYGDVAGNYTTSAMNNSNNIANNNRHPVGQGNGKWFLRNSAYSEPSGNYTSGCRIIINSSDVSGAVFDDNSCNVTKTKYLCSTYDK